MSTASLYWNNTSSKALVCAVSCLTLYPLVTESGKHLISLPGLHYQQYQFCLCWGQDPDDNVKINPLYGIQRRKNQTWWHARFVRDLLCIMCPKPTMAGIRGKSSFTWSSVIHMDWREYSGPDDRLLCLTWEQVSVLSWEKLLMKPMEQVVWETQQEKGLQQEQWFLGRSGT